MTTPRDSCIVLHLQPRPRGETMAKATPMPPRMKPDYGWLQLWARLQYQREYSRASKPAALFCIKAAEKPTNR